MSRNRKPAEAELSIACVRLAVPTIISSMALDTLLPDKNLAETERGITGTAGKTEFLIPWSNVRCVTYAPKV
jgi:hypothetical protein